MLGVVPISSDLRSEQVSPTQIVSNQKAVRALLRRTGYAVRGTSMRIPTAFFVG